MMQETWKTWPAHPTVEVSNLGQIRCSEREITVRMARWSGSEKVVIRLHRGFTAPRRGCPSYAYSLQEVVFASFGPDPSICLRPQDGWLVGEEWLPIDDGTTHFVSNLGRIKNVGRPTHGTKLGRILRTSKKNGYPFVHLHDGTATRRGRYVHSLVAMAFIGPVPGGHEINHIDGDRANSVASNLEYVTRGQNMLHASRVIGTRGGEAEGNTKLTVRQVEEIRRLCRDSNLTHKEIGQRFGVSRSNVGAILHGKSWVDHPPVYKR